MQKNKPPRLINVLWLLKQWDNIWLCFIEKESEKYVFLVTCAHEIAQAAAKLAEEAREIEKYNDTLVRKPHSKSGKLKIKTKLARPPAFPEEVEVRKAE